MEIFYCRKSLGFKITDRHSVPTCRDQGLQETLKTLKNALDLFFQGWNIFKYSKPNLFYIDAKIAIN